MRLLPSSSRVYRVRWSDRLGEGWHPLRDPAELPPPELIGVVVMGSAMLLLMLRG